MSKYTKLGYETGKLVDQKNAAYGSSFAKAGDFLRLLFPDGIAPDRFDDALLLARIFDKLMRIATDRDAFGESPYRDIAGYGLLGAVMHGEKQRGKTGGILPAAPSPTQASPTCEVSSLKEGLAAAFAREVHP